MARPTSPTLLPDHALLHLVRLEAVEQFMLVVVATTASEALCPLCQCHSASIKHVDARSSQKYLTQLCQADLQIAQTYELIQEFTTLLREREGERFDEWLSRVDEQGVSELQSFAQGLRRDYDAVKAGLTLEWSQGQVEGQVHRLKLFKRQMYDRGSFKLLRKRVLRRA